MALPTPYYPLDIPTNLRFLNNNNDLVSQLYPVANTQQENNPQTGFISMLGANVSTMKDQYNAIVAILGTYGTNIAALQVQVAAIEASGATAIPNVNGGCLNGSVSAPIDTVTALLVSSECSYITGLGTTSALASGIAAMNTSVLNPLPAYSQNSAMAGLAGWISVPTTVGAWMNNMSLAYLDMRVGVTQALSQSNVTCGDIDINISSSYSNSSRTITLYFPGSNIPTNFSDNTSHLLVEDTAGNQFTMNFNVITAVMTNGYLEIDISASTLLQTSNYTVTFTYNVTSTTPALGCSNTLINTVTNGTGVCPNLNVWSATSTTASFTFAPLITSDVVYTVDILDASGTTILDDKTFTNPTTVITDTFTNLTPATSYNIRVTVTVSGTSTICSSYGITTDA